MNFFEFFNVPMTFTPDLKELKKAYFINSKKYHPDFFTQASTEKQMEALEFSSLNNLAYNTLKDFGKCMKYILHELEILGEEGTEKVPHDFLLDMMEINEDLMEAKMSGDDFQRLEVQSKLDEISASAKEKIGSYLTLEVEKLTPDQLGEVKAFFLKERYLKRLHDQLTE